LRKLIMTSSPLSMIEGYCKWRAACVLDRGTRRPCLHANERTRLHCSSDDRGSTAVLFLRRKCAIVHLPRPARHGARHGTNTRAAPHRSQSAVPRHGIRFV